MNFLFIATVFVVFESGRMEAEYFRHIPQDYLKWNYSHVNPDCSGAGGGRNPCQDVRTCNFALASVSMGGWPTLCGWVGKGVPKVCCGLPLVLGQNLMKQVDAEKARKRECGRTTMSAGLSPTENKFFKIVKSMPLPDTSNPDRYDPPLDLSVEEMLGPPASGESSPSSDFPWMIAIYEGSDLLCGGTLIDRVHVLSAASCFATSGRDPELYMVRVGDPSAGEGFPYPVFDVAVHEGHRSDSLNHDVAILTLGEEILTPVFPHICLPSPELAAKDLAVSTAWHLEWNHSDRLASPVMYVSKDLPIHTMNVCRDATKEPSDRSASFGILCAGISDGSGQDCKISAGGPLMYKNNYKNLPPYHQDIAWVQIGVVSRGVHCGTPGSPLLYTKVSSHMDWISEHLKSVMEPK